MYCKACNTNASVVCEIKITDLLRSTVTKRDRSDNIEKTCNNEQAGCTRPTRRLSDRSMCRLFTAPLMAAVKLMMDTKIEEKEFHGKCRLCCVP